MSIVPPRGNGTKEYPDPASWTGAAAVPTAGYTATKKLQLSITRVRLGPRQVVYAAVTITYSPQKKIQ